MSIELDGSFETGMQMFCDLLGIRAEVNDKQTNAKSDGYMRRTDDERWAYASIKHVNWWHWEQDMKIGGVYDIKGDLQVLAILDYVTGDFDLYILDKSIAVARGAEKIKDPDRAVQIYIKRCRAHFLYVYSDDQWEIIPGRTYYKKGKLSAA